MENVGLIVLFIALIAISFALIIYCDLEKKSGSTCLSIILAVSSVVLGALLNTKPAQTQGIQRYLNNEVSVDTISIYKDGRLNEIVIYDRETLGGKRQ